MVSQSRLVALIDGNTRLLASNQFAQVDRILAGHDVVQATPEVMIAYLRSTFWARKLLNGWTTYLERVRDELSRRNLDVSRFLLGLDRV